MTSEILDGEERKPINFNYPGIHSPYLIAPASVAEYYVINLMM